MAFGDPVDSSSAVNDILGMFNTPSSPKQNSGSFNMSSNGNAASSIESMAGGVIGNAILPGIGGAIGSKALPLAIGGVQSLIGAIGGNKAKNELPPAQDVFERRRLQELDNQRKSFETGSAYASQRKQLSNIQSNAMRGAQKASGGNVGALLSAITRIGADAGDSYSKIAGEGTARQDMYNGQYGDMVTKMAERRATLQMQKYTQDSVDAGEQKKAGSQLLLSTLGLPGLGKSPAPQQQQNTVDNYIPPPSSLGMKPLFNPFA